MARPRTELSEILHGICNNVYFQPPTGKLLTYPCIVYERTNMNVCRADNRQYSIYDEYQITYITRDPDDINRYLIAELPLCTLTRSADSDNLYNHYYRLYF